MTRHLKKWKAFLTLFIFAFTGIISPVLPAYAFDPDNFTVAEITIGKTYDRDRNLTGSYLLIKGTDLQDAEVGVITDEAGYKPLTNRTTNSDSILQFEFTDNIRISSLIIGTGEINISESQGMPSLTGIDRKVKVNSSVNLTGTNLDQLEANNVEVKINNTIIDKSAITVPPGQTENASIAMTTGETGMQQLVFTRQQSGELKVGGVVRSNPQINIKYTYKDQFLLVQDLDISSDLEMFPNRGEKGDTIFFRATKLDDYDVFFVKTLDGTDPYTTNNRGQNPTFKADAEGSLDILTVQVPDIPTGEYYVVLTNKVPAGEDPMKAVISEWVVRQDNSDPSSLPEIFTVIDASNKAKIYSIQPNEGPDSGSPAVISGQFLGTLNINDFTLYSDAEERTFTSDNGETLIRSWQKTGGNVGKYKNTIDIKEVTRQITVIIGNKATFQEVYNNDTYNFTQDLDRLPINVPQVTDAATEPVKDVIVETTTVLTDTAGNNYTFKERAVLENGYTFIPSMIQPNITDIVPDKIEVIKETDDQYRLPEPRLIAIHGQNFMITRFEKDGQIITRYPVIRIGEIELNKDIEPELQVYVLSEDGRILDGSKDNEIGTKIITVIPDSKRITSTSIGKTFVEVVNPVRNSEQLGLHHVAQDLVEFVLVPDNKKPVIEKVTPDVVTIDGGEEIIIEGSNFAEGVKVFIDGEEVPGIERQGDSKKITFTAPEGREGETQLQVMNPEGGMATWPFTYVKAYTNPKITDFAPKKGNTGTLVMIKGDNFLKPDPTAREDAILKLIGTRVFLENIEVNEYNIDETTKKITLQDYNPAPDKAEPILAIVEGALKPASYYHALIFESAGGQFFTMNINAKGETTLSDGAGTIYTFYVKTESDGTHKIMASKEGGGITEVNVINTASLELVSENITLQAKTLYKVEDGVITGCRVKVMDINTILFTVPILEADGYYDVTVMNPDTRKDSKKDQAGFYYYTQPQSKPHITEINPSEGSVNGGYDVEIIGSDFIDNGSEKTRVYVNGMEVKTEDVSINSTGTLITFKMPAYPGDLREDKGTDRLAVPIVVVNPDGGTDSREEGFIYVVPRSYPSITKIVPAKGSAAGNDVVEITGSDFRYFEPYDDINRNQLWDEGEPYNDLNGNGTWDSITQNSSKAEPVSLNHPQYSYYFNSPILPRVYFGDEMAKIVEFDRGYIKVITPPAKAGQVDVYIVNNDSGVSNKVKFTYEGSNPSITKIVPDEGRKQGRENIEIYGSGFVNSSIQIYRDGVLINRQMPLVRFSDISNENIPREQPDSGRIDSGRATVNLDGGLKVEYRAAGALANLTVSITENDVIYERTIDGYDGTVKFIDVESLISTKDGITRYTGYELIKIRVEDRRLIVERGYSPEAQLIRSTQLTVKTPSYYTVGQVPVVICNPDGGTASGSFTYKNPDSKPKIINITRDGKNPEDVTVDGENIKVLNINYKAKSLITILGEDFRENAKVLIGDFMTISPQDIVYTLPGKLSFNLPVVEESRIGKLYRVVVVNEDGGTAASDDMPFGQKPIYIQFTKGETTPLLNKAEPLKGPAIGGTVVKIEGNDFRANMEGYEGKTFKVFFGGKEAAEVQVVDYKTVYAVTPDNVPGKHIIKIENPDGETAELKDGFEYISVPKITAVVSASDPAENSRVREISTDGGQEIKIKGSDFMPGAKVVFAPLIKTASADEADIYKVKDETKEFAGAKITSKELDYYVLESGTDAAEVNFIDSETLTVKVPKGKLDAKGVIVINPDKGGSDIYEDLTYTLPEISAPLGVTAEIIEDKYNDSDFYIKVNWNKVEGASQYEVYVIREDKTPEFAGSTDFTSFIYKDLEPYTSYKFVVTAVGNFGSSKYSASSNEVITGSKVGKADEDGALGEKTEIKRQGQTVNVAIGTSDFEWNNLLIDLTRGELAGAKKVVISIPAWVAADSYAKDVEIRGSSFTVKFNPRIFRTKRILENSNRSDAGVKLTFEQNSSFPGISRGGQLSEILELKAEFFRESEITSLDYLASNMSIILDYDLAKAGMRRFNRVYIARYDINKGTWEQVGREQYVTGSIGESINRLGSYAVAGSRR
ncbi:IPT/TIG domain-containing protein [Thermosyntropha sp.]|uniref:IPT/TIG domain-containing protein n=1 Tax=Thermosyntropha sp. TaxID=2740820 RepID=UPI0025F57520|nr:IPT/TIG domain-containing protein [Thermosyntropha sp.]MBO8157936.1 IPT/TIG domain-containing protein [Thermosyntropha sp.]